MSVAVAVPAFVAGALVSLVTSWFLVSRLERVGERLGLSEALLGIVAALAADAPEVTSAVTAMAGHQQRLGAGVVIGSNVFNLAALLGLGAVVAGRIRLHRKVVVLGGAVAVPVAGVCLAVVAGLVPPAAGCMLALAVVALYATVLGAGPRGLGRLRLPQKWITWLEAAVAEEELELEEAIRPRRARGRDAVAAAASLLVVIGASVTMERAASALGARFAMPEIVVGGLVLAAVTSLPNAVAAVYLAGRGRGAASFSTAMNSNTLNVVIGLLIPAVVIGIGPPSGVVTLVAAWYTGLTVVVLAFAHRDNGIRRGTGFMIIAAYLVFAGSLLVSGHAVRLQSWIAVAVGVAAAMVFGRRLMSGRRSAEPAPASRLHLAAQDHSRDRTIISANGSGPVIANSHGPWSDARGESLLAGWSVTRLWLTGLTLSVAVAAADAALGQRVVLIGLLIVGPCCALLTGRWLPTGLTGLWVIGLAVVLGLPDGIWGTGTHLAFMAAVATVAVVSTAAAAVIEMRR